MNRGAACRVGWLLALGAIAGCGPGYGKIQGRVLFDGSPLPGGRVTFRPAEPTENSVSVELDTAGQFEVVLPVGDVQVCVDNRELQPRPASHGAIVPPTLAPDIKAKLAGPASAAPPPPTIAPASSGRYVAIPERYFATETSGLRFTVARGDQRRDIELTK